MRFGSNTQSPSRTVVKVVLHPKINRVHGQHFSFLFERTLLRCSELFEAGQAQQQPPSVGRAVCAALDLPSGTFNRQTLLRGCTWRSIMCPNAIRRYMLTFNNVFTHRNYSFKCIKVDGSGGQSRTGTLGKIANCFSSPILSLCTAKQKAWPWSICCRMPPHRCPPPPRCLC